MKRKFGAEMEAYSLESGYVRVARKSEVPTGKMKLVTVEGKEILIVNVNGTYYAIGGKCTHAKVDLSRGSIQGSVVTCPKHGAQFDATSGKLVVPPRIGPFRRNIPDEPSYQVKVVGDDITIKL